MANPGRRRGIGIALAVATGVVLVNLTLWLVYHDYRRGLEAELARGLESVVAVLGELLDPALVERAQVVPHAADSLLGSDLAPTTAHDSLRTLLRGVADASELANVRLFDADGVAFLEVVGIGRGV